MQIRVKQFRLSCKQNEKEMVVEPIFTSKITYFAFVWLGSQDLTG